MKTILRVIIIFMWLAFINLIVDGTRFGKMSMWRLLLWVLLVSIMLSAIALG